MDIKPSHLKMMPLIAALAAAGYGVWPYVEGAPPTALDEPEPDRLAAELLEPKLPEVVGRNPFVYPSDLDEPVEKFAAAGSGTNTAAAKAETTPEPPRFNLGSTLVRGDYRAAIIDGRICEPGETVTDQVGRPWRVAAIEAGRVLLSDGSARGSLVLDFSRPEPPDPTGTPSTAGPEPAVATLPEDPTALLRALLGGSQESGPSTGAGTGAAPAIGVEGLGALLRMLGGGG